MLSERFFIRPILFSDNVRAICPFLERIPNEQHAAFLDDFVNTVAELKLREANENSNDFKFISPYKLVVAYARKGSHFLNRIIGNNDLIPKGLK